MSEWLDADQVNRLLRQDRLWIDKDLVSWRISARVAYGTNKVLHDRHLVHAERFLRRNYTRLWTWVALGTLAGEFEPDWRLAFGVDGQGRYEDQERVYEEVLPRRVEDTVLHQALVAEMTERGLTPLKEGETYDG